MRLLYYIALLIIIFICGTSHAQCSDAFLETRRIVLDQESRALGAVESAAVLPEGSIAVATADPGIFLFTDDGILVRQIGHAGRGPFEYQGSLTVRAADDDIAVWDAGNRKLLLFTSEGKGIREWSRLGRAVAEFSVEGDTLYAYHSGGINTEYVSIYHYRNQGTPADALGNAPGAHLPLSLLDGSGILSYNDGPGLLLYASPAMPVVHLYDVEKDSHILWKINDPNFDISAVSEYSGLENVSTDVLGAAEHALQSSRFYFLQTFGEQVLSVLQHGELTYEKSLSGMVSEQAGGGTARSYDAGGIETYTRYFNVHLHTLNGEPVACESLSFAKEEIASDSPIVGPTPRGFLVLSTRSTADDVEYVLTEHFVPER